jgi:hypothetical protein
VQRILKEHGIKSVQSLADSTAAVSFGAIEEAIGQSLMEGDGGDLGIDLDEEGDEDESKVGDEEGIDFRFVDTEDEILKTYRNGSNAGRVDEQAEQQDPIDRERLEGALRDLIACRQMLDRALKDG